MQLLKGSVFKSKMHKKLTMGSYKFKKNTGFNPCTQKGRDGLDGFHPIPLEVWTHSSLVADRRLWH